MMMRTESIEVEEVFEEVKEGQIAMEWALVWLVMNH